MQWQVFSALYFYGPSSFHQGFTFHWMFCNCSAHIKSRRTFPLTKAKSCIKTTHYVNLIALLDSLDSADFIHWLFMDKEVLLDSKFSTVWLRYAVRNKNGRNYLFSSRHECNNLIQLPHPLLQSAANWSSSM